MYNDLIPEPLQDELIFIRDSMTVSSWRIGDICREVIEYCKVNYPAVELQTIWAAIGSFVGKSSRSVREFAYLAGFYPLWMRNKFSVLSFDHYRHAATLGIPAAFHALEWAVAQGDVMNRPATVDALMARFAPMQPEEGEPPDFSASSPYDMIYGTVSRQVSLVEGWIGYDLGDAVSAKLQSYYRAARELQQAIEAERVTV